jgi:Bacteriophage protein gp37
MSDLFHPEVPDEFIRRVFETMNRASHHIFQVLTKRPERAARMADRITWSPNIWMGTSVENMKVIERVNHLRRIPARVRFLSCEPLLGPLELNLDGIHWVIVGGESVRGKADGPKLGPGNPGPMQRERSGILFQAMGRSAKG